MAFEICGMIYARTCGQKVSNLDVNRAIRDSETREEGLGRIGAF